MSRVRSSWKNSRGMTLMEILIVVAIIGGMTGLGIGVVRAIFDVELEKVASELSSTIRYLYGEAARRGEIYRLVINLDEESYTVESAPNEPETFASMGLSPSAEDKKKLGGEEAMPSDEEGEGESAATSSQGFQLAEDGVVKARKISPVLFKDVFVSHAETKTDTDLAYIYFFPNGSTEYAIINLSDEDDAVQYSIEVNPLTGKTKIRSEYYENPY